MINVMNKGRVVACAAALAVAAMTSLSSCDHKELCFDHNAHAPRFQLHVSAKYQQEWEAGKNGATHWIDFPTWLETYGMQYDDLRPLIPAGLRMHDFPKEGQSDMINMAAKPLVCAQESISCCSTTTTPNISFSTKCIRMPLPRPLHAHAPDQPIWVIPSTAKQE